MTSRSVFLLPAFARRLLRRKPDSVDRTCIDEYRVVMVTAAGNIDLHTHSTASDGSFTPTELAREAKRQGLSAFALTDHDIVLGNDEAARASAQVGVKFIPGMELTVDYGGHILHVVTLGFDADHPAFQKLYREIRQKKEAGIPELVKGIQARGVDITMDKVLQMANEPLDYYDVMRYLVSLKLDLGGKSAWEVYIEPVLAEIGCNKNASPREAFAAIHAAGGVTSLAHFHKRLGLKGLTREEQAVAIRELHAMGLDGMEFWYPSYTEDDRRFVAAMIDELGLMATGGTDFHGTNRPGIEMGTGRNGNIAIPFEALSDIQARMARYRVC